VEDFHRLTQEAHARGIRIIADLVLNHTSDQHAWFQESRKSRDNPFRDYYVWSDTDGKYSDARVIFSDTESSNWTWDHTARQYYWHRFYSHQPDLNYDNPAVRREVVFVM
jgi:maltose alpha-D-glucosyltransferase/alpha-amylase